MANQERTDKLEELGKLDQRGNTVRVGELPAKRDADVCQTPAELSPEEQMALFAQDLKEKDWGHQPC